MAAYLPYKLQIQLKRKIYPRGIEVKELGIQELHYLNFTSFEIKPILRPLSDLIKIININDDSFTPLYYLNRMRGVMLSIEEYDLFEDDGNCLICKYAGVYSFYFELQTMSFYDNGVNGISPQLEMFKKLHEWHFDLYGLIDCGLAIDINTLK